MPNNARTLQRAFLNLPVVQQQRNAFSPSSSLVTGTHRVMSASKTAHVYSPKQQMGNYKPRICSLIRGSFQSSSSLWLLGFFEQSGCALWKLNTVSVGACVIYPGIREQQHCQLRILLQGLRVWGFFTSPASLSNSRFGGLSFLLYRNADFIPCGNEENLTVGPKHTCRHQKQNK